MFFMADESNPVNDLVKEHIASLQPKGDANPEAKKVDEPPKGDPPPNPYADLFKELGVDSVEALKERLKPKVEDKKDDLPKSPEEKEKEANIYTAHLQSFAVENGIMKPEDFVKLENLKAKPDNDLLYEVFSAERKEDDPEITDEEIKEKFNGKYDLDSSNEKVKARGEARLKKDAASMRSPVESSYGTAKSKFDEERDLRSNFPNFDRTVRGFITESLPDKFEAYKTKDGEEEIAIEVDLTEDDKKEIMDSVAKRVQSPDTYGQFKKGDLTALKEMTQKVTTAFIRDRKREEVSAKIAETFLKRGFAKGSVGSKNPFPLNDGKDKGGGLSQGSVEQRILDNLKEHK